MKVTGNARPYWLAILCMCIGTNLPAQVPPGFIRERIAFGLNPTSITFAPDGSLFVVEKHGAVRIIRDGQLLPEPFLSIEVDDSNERGLGHLAFHPDFNHNGYVYVYYSVPGRARNRISRFTANGDKVIPGSEFILLDLDILGADVHNGGAMVFGEDGYLYVATGDGSQAWNGEDLGSSYGKVLRMDEWGNPVPDNPYYTHVYRYIKYVFASGLRNPYTIAQHPVTMDLYVNDVGWEKAEEINLIRRDGFYGWPNVEGRRTNEVVPDNYEDPVYAYKHENGACCIVGSAIYPPQANQFPPQYRGKYFFSDYCNGNMQVLNLETRQVEDTFLGDGDRVIDIDIARDGSLYYLERQGIGDGSGHDNLSTNEGTIWRVTYTGTGIPFISEQPEPLFLSEGEHATFTIKAGGGTPLQYVWYVNDHVYLETTKSSITLVSVSADMDSSLISVDVKNEYGLVHSASAMLRVTKNLRPQATITMPGEQMKYRAGDTITFAGFGMDHETGMMADSQLSWRIDFHHGTHAHPALGWTKGLHAGTYVIPSAGETSDDVWYRIYLRVEDPAGLSHVIYRDVTPLVGNINVGSQPSGLTVNLDGYPVQAPYTIEGVQGMDRYISAPQKQVLGDSVYYFSQWSDGQRNPIRQIRTNEEDQEYKAICKGIARGRGSGLTCTYYPSIDWQGEAVAVVTDSMVNHNFLFGPPWPGMDNDFYSITWEGYVQALHSGWYEMVFLADDGVTLTIDSLIILDKQELGYSRLSDSVYLESGKLYPVSLKYFEHTWGAQIKWRWSTEFFDEEPVPTSQLYPADYLHKPFVEGITHTASFIGNTLLYDAETSVETHVRVELTDVMGRSMYNSVFHLRAGKSSVTIPVSNLPPGIYFMRFSYANDRPDEFLQVVKAN